MQQDKVGKLGLTKQHKNGFLEIWKIKLVDALKFSAPSVFHISVILVRIFVFSSMIFSVCGDSLVQS